MFWRKAWGIRRGLGGGGVDVVDVLDGRVGGNGGGWLSLVGDLQIYTFIRL